ncbi:MAG: hypothetical protein KBS91_00645, partial [Firmicutes bacterium]|nr:hypothetical protein [Candidatus Caballimonas caccae]
AKTAEQILMENPMTYRVHSGSGKYYKFDLQAYKNNPKCIFWKLADNDEEIVNEMYIAPVVEEVEEHEEVVEEVKEEVVEEDTEVKDDVLEVIKEDNEEDIVEDYPIHNRVDGDYVASTYENEDLGNKIQKESQEEKELIYEQVEELASEYALENTQLKAENKQLKEELDYYKELSKGLTECVKNPFADMTVKEFIKTIMELVKE